MSYTEDLCQMIERELDAVLIKNDQRVAELEAELQFNGNRDALRIAELERVLLAWYRKTDPNRRHMLCAL